MPTSNDTPPSGLSRSGELIRLRRSLIRLQDETRLLRRDLMLRKYSPAQPRVPAGSTGGGRWTSGGDGGSVRNPAAGGGGDSLGGGGDGLAEFGSGDGFVLDETGQEPWASYDEGWSDDGSIFERDIVNRDGSTIQSEYAASREAGWDERHTVTLSDGSKTTFETQDRTQTIRDGDPDGEVISRTVWTPNGPEPDARTQPALLAPLIVGARALGARLTLFNWLSTLSAADGPHALLDLRAREFGAGQKFPEVLFVGEVSQEEALRACPRLPEVQMRLDAVVKTAGSPLNYATPGAYGTAMHTDLGRQVNALRDRNFVAERSTLKEAIEGDWIAHYAQKGSVRTDIVENVDNFTVCGYDIKTGKAILNLNRATELVENMIRLYPSARRFIIMQIKPRS
jgi:hypothetical protein